MSGRRFSIVWLLVLSSCAGLSEVRDDARPYVWLEPAFYYRVGTAIPHLKVVQGRESIGCGTSIYRIGDRFWVDIDRQPRPGEPSPLCSEKGLPLEAPYGVYELFVRHQQVPGTIDRYLVELREGSVDLWTDSRSFSEPSKRHAEREESE